MKFMIWLFAVNSNLRIARWANYLVLFLSNLLGMAIGLSSIILNMTGHQNTVATVYGIFCVVNIALNFLLIPTLGFLGAAIAYTITTFVYQIILTIYTRIKTGLIPSII